MRTDSGRFTPALGRLAFLLKPQWLALYVVVIAFAYLCFTVLAPWQLGKNTKTTPGEHPDLQLAVRRPGTGDDGSAATGFVGARATSGDG